jgi:hypothetical protein
MVDHVDPGHQSAAEVRIAHVTADDLDLRKARKLLQPAPIVEGVVVRQGGYLRAFRDQRLHEVGADKAVRARDQNPRIL